MTIQGSGHREIPDDRPRIFGIGLNKTGTMSLDKALDILGFRSLHDGGPETHQAVLRAVKENVPLLSYLDQSWDAFSDIGLLTRRFRILDAQYPGSKFVMTVRPMHKWLDSRRRHVERNIRLKESGEYEGSFLVVDIDKWMREWEDHTNRVRDFFANRSDFLEIDLTSNPQWGPLCRFLGRSVPATPFPWVNRDVALHRSNDVDV